MSSVLFLIGKTLGKYKVLEHVGHGGMSEVYKGQHVQLDRMVAVKVLHPFLADEEGFVVRFKREARIVATLRHPNIVQVYDFDFNEDLSIHYMVMEFIDGPTLKSRMANETLSLDEATHIGADIAEALDYAHQRGMVHRDIKPANIMFISDGQPVLTDFGIAKMLTLSGLTASGAMVGTPAYMAPEVGMGKAGTSASDIYSLGVVLYQMLTDQLPFESESPMGMVMQHINDSPPAPSQLNPEISPKLEQAILRAMEKQPEDRFANAGAMAAALREAMGIIDTPHKAVAAAPAKEKATPAWLSGPTPDLPDSEVETTPVFDYDVDDDDRLLKTWPLPAAAIDEARLDVPVKPATPAPTPAAPATPEAAKTPAPRVEEGASRKRRPLALRLLRALIVLLLVAAGGGAAWISFGGAVPAPVAEFLATAEAWLQPGIAANPDETATSEPTLTATVAPTDTPEPTLTATMLPSETPTAVPLTPTTVPCSYRFRLGRVRIEPDDAVPPNTPLVAYIPLHNSGTCDWPQPATFAFVSGESLAAPAEISVKALAKDESTQLIVPLQAPAEFGIYEGTWELRLDGQSLGSPVVIEIEVGDLPTVTPTPEPEADETPALPPLVLEAPALVVWEDDTSAGTWSGTLDLQATGGTGTYRYYQGRISDNTLLPEGTLSFEWARCEAFPVTVLVTSGAETVTWEGLIDYPDPDACP